MSQPLLRVLDGSCRVLRVFMDERENTELLAAAEECRPELVARARRRLREFGVSTADAEDVVQSALVRAWRLTQRPPAAWRAWLLVIVDNEARRWFQSTSGEPGDRKHRQGRRSIPQNAETEFIDTRQPLRFKRANAEAV